MLRLLLTLTALLMTLYQSMANHDFIEVLHAIFSEKNECDSLVIGEANDYIMENDKR